VRKANGGNGRSTKTPRGATDAPRAQRSGRRAAAGNGRAVRDGNPVVERIRVLRRSGRQVRKRVNDIAAMPGERIRATGTAIRFQIEHRFQKGLERTFENLGIPSRGQIDELTKGIANLGDRLSALERGTKAS
jgi:hypothetical protein